MVYSDFHRPKLAFIYVVMFRMLYKFFSIIGWLSETPRLFLSEFFQDLSIMQPDSF